jgi:hypothetical protein
LTVTSNSEPAASGGSGLTLIVASPEPETSNIAPSSRRTAPLPPLAAGSEFEVTVNWPGAGAGRGGRLELQADVDAPNKLGSVVLFSQVVDPAAFKSGYTTKIMIPADAPATLNDKGVAVHYRIRALVDRAFRSDLAVERFIAVM